MTGVRHRTAFREGYPLDEYLKKEGSPPLPQILRIALETAAGLAEFHAAVPGCEVEHDGGTIQPKK